MSKNYPILVTLFAVFIYALSIAMLPLNARAQVQNPQNGGVGMQGTISSPPPTQSPTISAPANGAVFTTLPVTVSGLCANNLLVKVFKNNVFAGSAVCKNGSYSIQIDLFSGKNDLTARLYDALDQAGPDSNLASITFNDNAAQANVTTRVSMSSSYARRGANPGQQLTWPIIISGGVAPYAVSVDWGDGSAPDVYSVPTPGEFTIKHKFEQAGVYRTLIKASDKNGSIAYLQLVAVGNGEATQAAGGGSAAGVAGASGGLAGDGAAKTKILWQPIMLLFPFIAITFWLGKRHEYTRARSKLARGENPFSS